MHIYSHCLLSRMALDTFTIRTSPYTQSMFSSEGKRFSLLRMLSPDPTHSVLAEEFVIWAALTLVLCFAYYLYTALWAEVTRRITGRKSTDVGAKKDPADDMEVHAHQPTS